MKAKLTFEEILGDFEIYGIQVIPSEDVKKKCLSLCEAHNLTGEQIAVSWFSFAASNAYEEVTFERLEEFEKDLIKNKKSRLKAENSEQIDDEIVTSNKKILSTDDDDLLAAYGASPVVLKKENKASTPHEKSTTVKRSFAFSQSLEELKSSPLAPSLSQSPTTQASQKYSQRTNSGAVVSSYGANVESTLWQAEDTYSPELKELPCGSEHPLTSPYNFMFEKLRDSSAILDDTIFHLGTQIKEELQLEETGHLRSPSNEAVWCVGRICCDSLGRLNAASVLLEGDRDTGGAATVRLDLTRAQKYSLFPGQVVAVNGINSSGECLVAKEIVNGKCLPLPTCPLVLEEKGIQLRIACGPFTTLDNLLYEPLMDLLEDVVLNPPHFLFLLGPVLDTSHPSLDDPLLADSYDSIVMRCLDKIDAALSNTRTQVYLVASMRDVSCTPIYPTPPVLLSGPPKIGTKVHLLPDPSLVDIDGVTVGLTTVDYPMHMSREEISCLPQGGDRLARLSQHMLLQQSFYPIYPPPEGMNVNLEQADLNTRLPFTPHLMVTPSDFKGYVKNVNGCVFVNPERLTKGKAGGCHCKLEVKPADNKHLEINAKIFKI